MVERYAVTEAQLLELWRESIDPADRAPRGLLHYSAVKGRGGKCVDCGAASNEGAKYCLPCGIAKNREVTTASNRRNRHGAGRPSKYDCSR